MSTWVDTLPADRVDEWIKKNGEAMKERHHTDDPRFALWLHYLDRAVMRRVMVSYQDFEDWDTWSAYEAGMSPGEAAEQMLEDAGWADGSMEW